MQLLIPFLISLGTGILVLIIHWLNGCRERQNEMIRMYSLMNRIAERVSHRVEKVRSVRPPGWDFNLYNTEEAMQEGLDFIKVRFLRHMTSYDRCQVSQWSNGIQGRIQEYNEEELHQMLSRPNPNLRALFQRIEQQFQNSALRRNA